MVPEQGSDVNYEDVLDLGPLLPASLETLAISEACSEEKDVMVKLLRSKKRYLPKWHTLTVSVDWMGWTAKSDPKIYAEVDAAANEAEVRYSVYSLLP